MRFKNKGLWKEDYVLLEMQYSFFFLVFKAINFVDIIFTKPSSFWDWCYTHLFICERIKNTYIALFFKYHKDIFTELVSWREWFLSLLIQYTRRNFSQKKQCVIFFFLKKIISKRWKRQFSHKDSQGKIQLNRSRKVKDLFS